jgi:predicted RNase H-like HicB family nuclease
MEKVKVSLEIPVVILREDKLFVAYTPVLDVASQGDTFEEAQKNFSEAVQLFVEEIIEMGTVDEVLTSMGWNKNQDTYSPPTAVMQQTMSIPFHSHQLLC